MDELTLARLREQVWRCTPDFKRRIHDGRRQVDQRHPANIRRSEWKDLDALESDELFVAAVRLDWRS